MKLKTPKPKRRVLVDYPPGLEVRAGKYCQHVTKKSKSGWLGKLSVLSLLTGRGLR